MKSNKFSIITPTHLKNAFLDDLYDSILKQTYDRWEWVIYLNGNATRESLAKNILNDSRVVVIDGESHQGHVGGVKNAAFHAGTGDVLVEVDHDDILMPTCLEKLNEAYQDESVGFAYSDCAVYHMTDQFHPYGSAYGWTFRTIKWNDKELIAMDSFKPTSHSI